MDEPTSSLAAADVERLFETVRRLRDRGITVVYISHFLEEVREIATRYTVLRDGRSVGSGELTSVSDDALIAMMVGRDVEVRPLSTPRPPTRAEQRVSSTSKISPRLRVSAWRVSLCIAARFSASQDSSAQAGPISFARSSACSV